MTAKEFDNSLVNLREGLEYFAYSLTYNREDAKDLVQETFLKALVNKDKFEDNTNLKAWTYTILRNTFINNYRRSQKSEAIMDSSQDLLQAKVANRSTLGIPEMEISIKEIDRAIASIDEEQRIPFQMQCEGHKYREIAEYMHLSIGTVKSRIFFCRKKLIEQLKEFQN